jgi:hypothetical protein
MAACNKHNDPEKHRPKRSASLHCNAPLFGLRYRKRPGKSPARLLTSSQSV